MGVVSAAFPWAGVLILLPLGAAMVAFLWPRVATESGVGAVVVVCLGVTGFAWQMFGEGTYLHHVGGWGAPLGIDLFADGLSLWMLSVTATVGLGISLHAAAGFREREAVRFWPLWMLLLAALNALFLSADIFNIYVAFELIGMAAVALVALAGNRDALAGAMGYLLATLLGSLTYLLGVVLLYHGYGTVDISLLAARVEPSPVSWAALGLVGAGLLLKTAVFPLHFWLPPAHATAPASVSALLSALVVKASFYILLRFWLELFSPLIDGQGVPVLLGLLGAGAVLWGSVQALRQGRLKLLIAYSTVAQIGYLLLAFPLAAAVTTAWYGALYLILSHALAKAAMFLAAGNLLRFGGHDRIADLDRVVQRLPLTAGAIALAGVSIIGLPPSGGFVGKWLLLEAAVEQGHWELVGVMILGSLLAAGYIFKVLGYAFTQADTMHESRAVPAMMEWTALLLACGAVLLGFVAVPLLSMAEIGDPFDSRGIGG